MRPSGKGIPDLDPDVTLAVSEIFRVHERRISAVCGIDDQRIPKRMLVSAFKTLESQPANRVSINIQRF
jgi:hypothetical protein